jgi:hypothetical protein
MNCKNALLVLLGNENCLHTVLTTKMIPFDQVQVHRTTVRKPELRCGKTELTRSVLSKANEGSFLRLLVVEPSSEIDRNLHKLDFDLTSSVHI